MSDDRAWHDVNGEFTLPQGLELRELAGTEISPFNFEPPGPVGESFLFSQEPIDYLMGPAGSGKTVVAIARLVVTTLRYPVCKDGVKRVRIPVIRDNFRTLYRTTLPSIFKFFPKDFPGATFEGGQDRPFCFTLRFITPKGVRLQLVLDGFGLGENKIEDLLKGYEPSAAMYDEADLLAQNVKTFMFGRVAQGRYPGRGLLADPNAVIPRTTWGTFNPPLISHYIKQDFVDEPMGGHVLRRQPSGLSDQAENRKHVTREDYEAMAATMKPDEVRRFVKGEWGIVGDGALVYPSFDYTVHVAKGPLEPLDLPLLAGFDAKGTPAGVLFQYTPKGQMRVLAEVVGEPNMSAGRFAIAFLDMLQSRFRGLPMRHAWGDPSGFFGADRAAGELSFLETISSTIGVQILPTATNDPSVRQEAVDWFLRRPTEHGSQPYYLVGDDCKQLMSGFQGGFLIKLNRADTSDATSFVKNKFSHVHEAQQYGAYGVRGHAGVIQDAARAGRAGNVVVMNRGVRVRSDFNP